MTARIGSAAGGITGSGSFSVTPPAGAAGYLALLTIGTDAFPAQTPPSGWTLVASDHTDAFSSWYLYTGVPGAGANWTTIAGWSATLVIAAYDTAVAVNARNTVAATNVSPAITPAVQSLIVRAQTGNPYPDLATVVFPASTTGQVYRQDPTTNDPDDHSLVAICESGIMAAGSTGTATWGTTGNDSYSSHTIAITNVASTPRGGFATAMTLGPADASGHAPNAGSGFATSMLWGPAAAEGAAEYAGGFATSYAFGPAAAHGPSNYRFPRIIHPSGRYFLDQAGDPIMIKGDSPWSAFTDLSVAQWETWCENRAAKGFNACYISAVGDAQNGGRANGETYDGIFPFVGGNIITAPNETYWARVDQFFDIAAEYGITIFLYLIDGWNVLDGSDHVFDGQTVADCYTYGEFIGNRYGDRENVVWMVGGDYSPVTNEQWAGAVTDHQFDAALRGARDTEAIWHAQAIQLLYNRSWSTQNVYWRRRVDFQHVYTYQPTYEAVWQAYFNTPGERVAPDDTRAPIGTDPLRPNIPALFMEGHYEFAGHNLAPSPLAMRRQAGWAATAGSPGDFYGNDDWKFETGWETRLDSDGAVDVGIMRAAVEQIEWWRLVPNTSFITSGAGTVFVSTDNNQKQIDDAAFNYVTAALAVDGSLGLLYFPAQMTVTIDTALLGTSPSGTWVNASTGAQTAATVGSSMAPPSSGDWLLILEATPLTPPEGGFATAYQFGPAAAGGEAPAEGGFATSYQFGPADASGERPSEGGFAGAIQWGPATAAGEAPAEGGFATSTHWGPAGASGEAAAEGGFGATVHWGPATASGDSPSGGGFATSIMYGPATAEGAAPAEGGFEAAIMWGPASFEGGESSSGGFETSTHWGPAEAAGSAEAAGGFETSYGWGPAVAGGEPVGEPWPSVGLLIMYPPERRLVASD